ncbi:beta-galactosidase trimerization domain-containing protein [Oerskovia sp. M15]
MPTRSCTSRCASQGRVREVPRRRARPRGPHRHPRVPGGRAARRGARLARRRGARARTPARVALLFDWESWWAAEMTDGFNRHARYVPTVLAYYRALWQANVDVDVVPVTADLSGYDVVVAPMLHLLRDGAAERLEAVVGRGGSVLASFWTGRVDEDDNAFPSTRRDRWPGCSGSASRRRTRPSRASSTR